MKKLVYLIAIVLILPVISGCEDFLDTTNYTSKDESSFPQTESDANQLLVGVYSMLNRSHEQGIDTYLLIAELASDDRFGGGGENDKAFHAISHLMYSDINQFNNFWQRRYEGISRANLVEGILQDMPEGNVKNQKIGEARFLRAHYYFELVQIMGDIPVVTKIPEDISETKNSPAQVSAKDVVFPAIATDLWNAYSEMPSTRFDQVPSGTVTKWAAAGLLARVFLFYTGFYGETALPIEEGQVTKAQVIAALEDCIANSGHDLLPDFRSLWPYSNSLTKKDYRNNGFNATDAPDWVEGTKNPEVMFVVKMNGLGSWQTTTGYSNSNALFFAIRDNSTNYEDLFPMGQGWGAGPVNTRLWTSWPTNDPRRTASIYNQATEAKSYKWGSDSQMEETGLWQKKIVATRAYGKEEDDNDNALWNSFWSAPTFGNLPGDEFQLAHGQDLILMRFADILLMHSELSETNVGLNRVRARANASIRGGSNMDTNIPYSLEAIQNERRWELAFEGLRWGDIRRWKVVPQVFAGNNYYEVTIRNRDVETTMKNQGGGGIVARYEATQGFFNKPNSQIELSAGSLIQNDGWGTEASFDALTN